MAQSDLQQLVGILNQFDEATIQEAVDLYEDDHQHTFISVNDVEDPGTEVTVGEDSVVDIEDMSRIERIIDPKNNLLPVHFLEEGAVVQKPVAKVRAPSWVGTGFLVSNSLFMTNNHVLPNSSIARNTKALFNYQLDFQGNTQQVDEYSMDPDNVFYTNAALDFTLVRLRSKRYYTRLNYSPLRSYQPPEMDESIESFDMTGDENTFRAANLANATIRPDLVNASINTNLYRLPFVNAGSKWGHLKLRRNISLASKQHLNIIQHPRGRRKEVALQHNELDKIYSNVVRYTTDTEPGSSGSPVFNNEWDLLSIHHAAGEWKNGKWVSNEGIRIDKIVQDLRNHFLGTPSGNAILNELGIA